MKRVISIVVALCLLGTGVYLYTKYRVAPKIAFKNLALVTLEGQPASLPANKKLIVNFFATWCGPCVAELPSLVAASDKLKDKNFEVICISDEKLEKLTAFKNYTGISIPILKSVTPLNSLGINSIPVTYVINEKGQIVYTKSGSEKWSSDEMIEKIISKTE
jgi:thiol-disulfide isomerase/thioredoxin